MDLEKKIKDLEKSVNRLKEAYEKTAEHRGDEEYQFFRDSAIQRFEFTVEILWKSLKSFLYAVEGINCKSPKGCIREFFSSGYITPEETTNLLEMIDSRNKTSHTYHEEIAEEIFLELKEYIPLIEKVLNIISSKR